jgi:hypothetical protein
MMSLLAEQASGHDFDAVIIEWKQRAGGGDGVGRFGGDSLAKLLLPWKVVQSLAEVDENLC